MENCQLFNSDLPTKNMLIEPAETPKVFVRVSAAVRQFLLIRHPNQLIKSLIDWEWFVVADSS